MDLETRFEETRESVLRRLAERGFELNRSVLIELFPDSETTFCGEIVRQDGRVFSFDIDLEHAGHDSVTDITDMIVGNSNARNKKTNRARIAALRKQQAMRRGQ